MIKWSERHLKIETNGTSVLLTACIAAGMLWTLGWGVECAATDAPQLATPVLQQPIPGNRQIALSWGLPVGSAAATSYNIYMGTASGAETLRLRGVVGTTRIVTGLGNDTASVAGAGPPYYFVVTAVMGGTESAKSNEVSATPTASAAPSDVTKTVKDGQVTLMWTSVGATSYEIWKGVAPNTEVQDPTLTGISDTSATITGLNDDGTTYFFVVKAVNESGGANSSAEIWATPRDNSKVKRSKASCTLDTSTIAGKAAADDPTKKPDGNVDGSPTPTSASPPPTVQTSTVSGADVLSNFSTSTTSGATLASTTIVKGYVNAWIKQYSNDNCGLTNAISVDLSATAAATTTNFTDYAREELLGPRSGIVNLYFNPFAGRDASNPYYQWNGRELASDHIYMKNPITTLDTRRKTTASGASGDDSKTGASLWDQALGFYTFGFGARGVKTALQGSNLAAVGTAYFGIGLDAPFHDTSDTSTTPKNTGSTANPQIKDLGGLSAELYLTANYANRNAVDTMFGIKDGKDTYTTYGGSMTFWLTGKLYLSLEYDQGLGSYGQKILRDEALLRFGYGSSKKSTSAANPGGGT